MKNPLIELENFGQSIWLDYISRHLLNSGELKQFIVDDHLKGVTSNPSIFEKAIAKSTDYHDSIKSLDKNISDPQKIYEQLAIDDIQQACDLLRATYDASNGIDGYACLEVSPHLAYDTKASIEEGRRLWQQVDRPNLMVKIPGTSEGMGAIRSLIALGINVNVTLLFSVSSYQDAADAYLLGLSDRIKSGLSIDSIHSVASFFVSRIDTKVDRELERMMTEGNNNANASAIAKSLMGTIAIANAKLAYANFLHLYEQDFAKKLIQQGAHPQRLLWASTSTKNPRFSELLYVESLIAKDTVNTLPLETLLAFKDHGKASNSLTTNLTKAKQTIDQLADVKINFPALCNDLQKEGIQLFINAFDQLLAAVLQLKLSLKS